MKATFLVQRLLPPNTPTDHKYVKLLEMFSFGAGKCNGGLTEDAMVLLRPLFRFDYMGSSEFEWGAVPDALAKIQKHHPTYEKYSYVIDPKKLKHKPWACHEAKPRDASVTTYVYGPVEEQDGVCAVVQQLANNDLNLQEPSLFPQVVYYASLDDSERQPIAWLELNNGFFFTMDENLCDKFIALMTGPLAIEKS